MDTVKEVEIEFTFTNNDKLEFKLIHFDNEGRLVAYTRGDDAEIFSQRVWVLQLLK